MNQAAKAKPTFRLNDELGKIIRARRKELGLTQTELAERVGTRQQVIAHIERGVVKRTVYAAEICKVLKLNLDTTLFANNSPASYLKEEDYQHLEEIFGNTLQVLADFNALHDKPFIPKEEIPDAVELLMKKLKKYMDEG